MDPTRRETLKRRHQERRQQLISQRRGCYSYSKLHGDTDVRLLTLFAGSKNAPVVCELTTYSLANAPSSDALSYVWGTSDERRKIRCDGKDLYITPNLYQALQQVRRVKSARIIWAGQVCINQQDPQERGHQVALMGSIYSRVHKVFACLGGTRKEGRQLSAFIEEFTSYMETEIERQGVSGNIGFARHPDSFVEASGFRTLQNIFGHPYFTRIWVIQELGLAATPVVLVGYSKISWATLLECTVFLQCNDRAWQSKVGSGREAYYRALGSWGSQDKRHWLISEGDTRSFLDLLGYSRSLEASDERDRIFAFLGHPTARMADGSTIVKPDYTTDLDSCLFNFAKQWIVKNGDMSILSAVDTCRRRGA